MKAVLFESVDRFSAFHDELQRHGVEVDVLNFESADWLSYDYSKAHLCLYFPEFTFSNNHPLALYKVYDNLTHVAREFPHLKMFPDPKTIHYYNDKYRQYLFLQRGGFPIPKTQPLYCSADIAIVGAKLGFPLVVKNRFGAGGEAVMKVQNERLLRALFRVSTLDLFCPSVAAHFLRMFSKRVFYYHLIKDRKMLFPFLSPPLLAQQFVSTDSDVRVVTFRGKVIEAHWRKTAGGNQWKVNIDGGGIGEWSRIPPAALDLAETISRKLDAEWLALDLLRSGDNFLVTEFSPVWHHYAYKEKNTFVYKDDYNVDVPLDRALDLEKMVVESLITPPGPRGD